VSVEAPLAQYLVGLQGVALLRRWPMGPPEEVREGLEAAIRLARGDLGSLSVVELDAEDGYDGWSPTYDEYDSPLIHTEQPVVRELLASQPPGDVLDAACGTGRHGAWLAGRGHRVIGVDGSPEMIERARVKHPEMELRVGTLESLPLEPDAVDLSVCGLSMAHCPAVARPVAELARVTRSGGRVVISEISPTVAALGGHALYAGTDGRLGLVRHHFHPHSEYLAAFRAAGLEVRDCREPTFDDGAIDRIPFIDPVRETVRGALRGIPYALVFDLSVGG
jgi:ubiquinone/menaquinone biosynthesis C-methylase UbiE